MPKQHRKPGENRKICRKTGGQPAPLPPSPTPRTGPLKIAQFFEVSQCAVVAPPLIPLRPSDRVKTNRRDGIGWAKLLRADGLTAVWVPDEDHEAMRNLVRARTAAVETLRFHRQHITSIHEHISAPSLLVLCYFVSSRADEINRSRP